MFLQWLGAGQGSCLSQERVLMLHGLGDKGQAADEDPSSPSVRFMGRAEGALLQGTAGEHTASGNGGVCTFPCSEADPGMLLQ